MTSLLASALVIFGAASASAYATSISSPQAGSTLGVSDSVTVSVNFDSEGAADITLLSVGVHFDNTIFTHSGSNAATYALYATPAKGAVFMVPASTNGQLRVGTNDQVNMDWISSGLPDGNRDAGSFEMGTLTFHVQALGDGMGDFTLSNNSAGNILQLGDASNPNNAVSGDFVVYTPEPTTALLVGLGLLGLGVAGRRNA
jgi:hypothetical protein